MAKHIVIVYYRNDAISNVTLKDLLGVRILSTRVYSRSVNAFMYCSRSKDSGVSLRF